MQPLQQQQSSSPPSSFGVAGATSSTVGVLPAAGTPQPQQQQQVFVIGPQTTTIGARQQNIAPLPPPPPPPPLPPTNSVGHQQLPHHHHLINQSQPHHQQQKQQQQQQQGELPLTVLGCPDCDFLCTSNNQMCRHIFMTNHGVYPCTQCNARLLCWAFAPGVQKLFVKAKKDGVVVDAPAFETAEKHQERTGHVNTHIPGKDKYVKPGLPEDYGLANSRAPQVDASASANRYNCPQCQRSISTWTQMTKHLDNTKHSLCRCAECDVVLKCYGMSQPIRHEKLSGHRGIVGLFRMKMDYLSNATGPPVVPQYSCEDCGIGYLHPLHIAHHLAERHNCRFPPVKCAECGVQGTLDELAQHRLVSGHEDYVEAESGTPFLCEEHLLSLPEPPPPQPKEFHTTTEDSGPSGSAGGGDATTAAAATTSDGSTSPTYRILYQCPQCYFIATSWPEFEKHLFATKHTLAFDVQSNAFLPPLASASDVPHRTVTGHRNIFGEQMYRSQYESLVDISDSQLREQIVTVGNFNAPSLLEQATTESGLTLYQCPLDDRSVHMDAASLFRHWDKKGPNYGWNVKCDCCEPESNEFSLKEETWRSHLLSAGTHPAILEAQKNDGDWRVWAPESALVGGHSSSSNNINSGTAEAVIHSSKGLPFQGLFSRCDVCGLVLLSSKLPQHRGSIRCAALKLKKELVEKAQAAKASGLEAAAVEEILCSGVLPPNAAPSSSPSLTTAVVGRPTIVPAAASIATTATPVGSAPVSFGATSSSFGIPTTAAAVAPPPEYSTPSNTTTAALPTTFTLSPAAPQPPLSGNASGAVGGGGPAPFTLVAPQQPQPTQQSPAPPMLVMGGAASPQVVSNTTPPQSGSGPSVFTFQPSVVQ